jgi:hypothetical protein
MFEETESIIICFISMFNIPHALCDWLRLLKEWKPLDPVKALEVI